MQWGKIKTLLILSFLVLDVYLFMQFMDKKENMDLSFLEYKESSIEEQLAADAITIHNLPEKEYEETFITVKQKEFSEKDLVSIKGQHPLIYNNYFVISKLDKPLSVPADMTTEAMVGLLQGTVYGGDEYTYWGHDEELNVLIYFQNKHGQPVYYNQNGLVLLFLDEEDKVSFYTQTMLGDADTLSENKKLIKPMQAIEVLYSANELSTNDDITSVSIGFHTRIPLESGVQVFAPVWRVNVNGEKNYFINALEGLTNTTDDETFLIDTIKSGISRFRPNLDGDKVVEGLIKDLEERIVEKDIDEGE